MSQSISVSLKRNSYKIVVGDGVLNDAGKLLKQLQLGSDAIIISNPVILKYHGQKLVKSLNQSGFSTKVFAVASGERSKSIAASFKLLEQIASYDVFKKVFIIAFGGGVVGDLAGFVASIYKRGVPYVQIPTTLLAQVDSAIGGKVAIDLKLGKNLVGSFYQPKLVLSDVAILKTLDRRQIRNGLAEVIKYGIIRDERFFDFVEKNIKELLNKDVDLLTQVVLRSSQIKTDVVLADEFETKGIRTILNFGHTIGHAIESAAKYDFYHHGEAIALGMRVATEISVAKKLLNRNDQERINNLLTFAQLPKNICKVKVSEVLKIMNHDKKFVAGKNRFVLAKKIGKVSVVENIALPIIINAIRKYLA